MKLVVGLAVIAVALALPLAASTQTSTERIAVDLTLETVRLADVGPFGLSVGDARSEVFLVWVPGGDVPIGTAYVLCFYYGEGGILGAGAWDCNFNLHMPLGKIRAAGVRRRFDYYFIPVVGGTRRYADAHGGTLSLGRSFPGRFRLVVELA